MGGLVSFITGSLFLFEEGSGYKIPVALVVSTSLFLFLLMGGITYFAIQAIRRGERNRQKEKYEGQTLEIKNFDKQSKKGMGFFRGELWKVESREELSEGDFAEIIQTRGLTLVVKKQ